MNARAAVGFLLMCSIFAGPCTILNATLGVVPGTDSKEADPAFRASIVKNYGDLPLSFAANGGQADDAVRFLSRGNGYTLFLTSSEAVFSLTRKPKGEKTVRTDNSGRMESKPATNTVLRLRSVGSNPNPKVTGLDELPGRSNYFIGNDPAKWRTNVPNYAKVQLEDVYPGIDLVYYGNQRQLEYDWIVDPGADPQAIRFVVEGDAELRVDARGNLLVDEEGQLCLHKPFIYQQRAGSRVEIAGEYVLAGKRAVSFELDPYDLSLPLVIDPVLSYSRYLGGISGEDGGGIAVDSSGNAYVTGITDSSDFPTTYSFQNRIGGNEDVYVTKLNASGSALEYCTFIGGRLREGGRSIAVDSAGNAYVTGETESNNFPVANAYQGYNRGERDAFVTKLNSTGSALVYSTYLGASNPDTAFGIAVDSAGNAYVAGSTYSTNFPTVNAFQAGNAGGQDAFVAKLNAEGNTLAYSTYLGGSGDDEGAGVAVDSSGNAHVAGETSSTNFPTVNAFQRVNRGNLDAYVAKLNVRGSALLYSTYLGGAERDHCTGIAVDPAGHAYVTGQTESTLFPTANPVQPAKGGEYDAFVTKMSISGGSLVYSTYLGGDDREYLPGIAVDSSGSAYVSGHTHSTNFPVVDPVQAALRGVVDAFVTKLNPQGSAFIYSTYLGGSGFDYATGVAADSSGNAYVTGTTNSTDFPRPNPFQAGFTGGESDSFMAKIGSSTASITISASPATCSFTVDGQTFNSAQTFSWAEGSSHTIGVVTPQGTGGTRYVFAGWSDGGAVTHAITVSSNTPAYTATFTTQYQLVAAASPAAGGAISPSPTSPDGYYASGTQVQLWATAHFGYAFSEWSGDLIGTANPQTVLMSVPRVVIANFLPAPSMILQPGGAGKYETPGSSADMRAGYAVAAVPAGGTTPYGTAVFRFRQNSVTVSEAGVPASPPTTRARVFIDYRKGVRALPGREEAGIIDISTGIAVVNPGVATADVTYTLRDSSGKSLTAGHGTIEGGRHFACFINELRIRAAAPDFNLPPDFQTATQFGTLEVASSLPLSVLALRGTMNQRYEFLMTTTPVADLTQSPGTGPIYFPQFVDGGGYTTSLVLLNTSTGTEIGTLQILDDNGAPLVVNQAGGTSGSSFRYEIPPGGAYRFQTDGAPAAEKRGWVRLSPVFNQTPVGSGVFGYNPDNVMVTESGIPATVSTTHARIYVDLSRNHNTGLAIANVDATAAAIAIRAFQTDGVTEIGTSQGPLPLAADGHTAAFADQFVKGLPAGFTGVLDISSSTPFAALTLRSLVNERDEFLMTTFPVADANMEAPQPYFPHVVDGGGYVTEFILISPTQGWGTNVTLNLYSEDGARWKF